MNRRVEVNNAKESLAAIHQFLIDTGYNIISFANDTCVADVKDSNFKVVFFANDKFVYITLCEKYNASTPWYKQEGTVIANKLADNKYLTFKIPSIKGAALYCNSNDKTLMFSQVEDKTLPRKTYSFFIGNLMKHYSQWEGGEFIGGTFCDVLDESGESIENRELPMFKDNTKRVYFAMRVTIDESPSIPRDKTVWATDNDFTKLALVASIVTPERNKKLPTYNVLASEKINLPTHDWNTLNCISLCLPIIFYVIRDPQILDLYSVVGSTNVINFVDMYNMSSGRLMNADYPIEKSKYQCFTIYTRRNLSCMIGYSGLAFLQEGE